MKSIKGGGNNLKRKLTSAIIDDGCDHVSEWRDEGESL